jgi:hypothetical protein
MVWVRRGRIGPCLAALVGLLLPAFWVSTATDAAFTAQTLSSGNTWTAGTVALSDDDAGSALFNVSGLIPGQSVSRCITVSYAGTLPAQVRLYGTIGAGTGLAPYLDLQVMRGSFSGASAPDCTGFSSDGSLYLGPDHDGGLVYDDAATAFPTSWASSRPDPDGTPSNPWTPGDSHAYRFTFILRGDDAAQGLTASASFVFAARDTGPPELDAGQVLHRDVAMRSADGNYMLIMQGDSNLVVYDISSGSWVGLWSTGTWTYNDPRVELYFQADGNLQLIQPGTGVIWESNTAGSGATKLIMGDDGYLHLQKPDGTDVWTD